MELIPVISTSIKSIGWEDDQLHVEYPNGTIYQYGNVPLATFQQLRISQSVGKTLRSEVVNKGNPYKKIYDPNKSE